MKSVPQSGGSKELGIVIPSPNFPLPAGHCTAFFIWYRFETIYQCSCANSQAVSSASLPLAHPPPLPPYTLA